MRLSEICGCGRKHGGFLAEAAAFEGQPTIAPQEYPLAARFAAFNRRHFGGALPPIPLGFARMKGRAGQTSFKVVRQASGAGRVRGVRGGALVPNTLRLDISSELRRPEAAFDSILLHEMIHVAFAVEGRTDVDHGPEFQARARSIGAAAGIPVPVVCPSDWFAVPVNQTARPVGVLLLRKRDSTHSFAILAPGVLGAGAAAVEARFGGALASFGLSRVTLWQVANAAWSALAMQVPAQRALGPQTRFFALKDETPLADLERDGKLLADIST